MKIVVLDGETLNPGDLDWGALDELGEVSIYPGTTSEELLERMADAEIAITNKVVFDRAVMNQLPSLRYIGVTATGSDKRGPIRSSTNQMKNRTEAISSELRQPPRKAMQRLSKKSEC